MGLRAKQGAGAALEVHVCVGVRAHMCACVQAHMGTRECVLSCTGGSWESRG